jgi:hypothetical protein
VELLSSLVPLTPPAALAKEPIVVVPPVIGDPDEEGEVAPLPTTTAYA